MTARRRPVLAVNTLSVTTANEGIRTMLPNLVGALVEVAPELDVVLVCSPANRDLFSDLAVTDLVEVPLGRGQVLRRIVNDQVTVPRLVRARADVLLTPSSVAALWCPLPQIVLVPAHLALPSCQETVGVETWPLRYRLYNGPVLRAGLRRADRVLAISRFLADGLVSECGAPAGRTAAMPLGVRAPVAPPPPGTARPPMVLFVGTLYPYKDAAVALDAFAAARPRLDPDARLVVVGRDPDGAQLDALTRQAADLGIASTVELRGSVTDEVLWDLYREAAALVMPSRCEGFGLPVAEAMAMGAPVIVAGATSLPEVVGDAGLVVPPGDVTGFADAMVEAVASEERREELAARGRARAAELTWEAAASVLYETVEELLR